MNGKSAPKGAPRTTAAKQKSRRKRTLRITQPAGKVELSAETRRLVADAIRAHDDDGVSLLEYLPVIGRLDQHLDGLSREEQLEVSGLIFAATVGARYMGWGRL